MRFLVILMMMVVTREVLVCKRSDSRLPKMNEKETDNSRKNGMQEKEGAKQNPETFYT